MAAVLMIRRGGLGDTLLLLPLLAALRREHPGHALHVAGQLEFTAVLAHFGAVDAAMSSEDLLLWALAQPSAPGERARARLRGYRRIVADDPAVLALASAGGPRVQVFDPRPRRHDAALALQFGDELGLAVDLADARFPGVRRGARDGPLVLAPGAGAPGKCWPRARWLELADRLAARAQRVAVVVGPTEVEGDDPRRWPWPLAPEFLTLSCTELAERLATARAFVGNDSGPTHLAAAVGVAPTVALFGPGWPVVYAPPGRHVWVLRARTDGPPDVTVAAVLAALAGPG